MTRLIVTTHAEGAELQALRDLAAEAGAELRVADRAENVQGLPSGTQVYACACAREVSDPLRVQAEAGTITLTHVYHLRRLIELERARKTA